MRGVLITVRDKVPALMAEECHKEPTGVVRTYDSGMLGKAEEGEPFALTVADESIHLCLLEEGEKAGRILQIVRDNMTK